ncbi:sensor histidine kinase [Kutzneria sp. CA-103260]|uniref:sensor histidine kinase n=1 Tax=Kutzneria sp. CA-103260 TaxID=2802641 RepID=UPI001BACE272|nr:histidine kinase [Kutzneria sp. CA-103260]QUQ67149.1 Histidine kinase [Kutzneria sp. CA-103260]
MWERVLDRLRARLEASLADARIALPWWVPIWASGLGTVFAVIAVVQRSAVLPPALIVLALALMLVTALMWVVSGVLAPSWLKAVTVVAAVAVLLNRPVVPDFAPILLALVTAELAAIARPRLAVATAAVGIAVLGAATAWAGLVGFSVYSVAVLLGLCAGFMLRWYVRALDAERGKQEAIREQAILAERQHIAREVHDVVGHSLSITLLHLTGARRALQQDRNVDNAVDTLTEAERVGRLAMADFRGTISLLTGSSGTQALPGVDDIAGLVERTRAAGLDVRYEQSGDLTAVTGAAGLGLYRIAQESLANVTKHASDSTVRIRLRVGPDGLILTVRNRLSGAVPDGRASGNGLAGMSARAAQLGAELFAGPKGGDWVVDVRVPCDVDAPDRPVAS